MKKPKRLIWNIFLAIIILIGIYNFYIQTVEGHYHSGLSDMVPWGIFISAFAFFVGTSAGATIIGLMIHAFGRKDYEPLATRALLVGLLSLMASMLFLIVDVGNPIIAMFVPWILMNAISPFFYTSTSYYIFGSILVAELYYVVKFTIGNTTKRDETIAKWLAIIAVPFALIILHAITGSIFAFSKSREFWNTAILPPHFAISALASGTAVIILVAVITPKIIKRDIVGQETLDHIGTLLAFFLSVTLFFDIFDLLILNFSEKLEGMEAWHLLTGEHLPFLVMNIGGLILSLIILFFKQGRSKMGLAISSTIVILSIAAYRYNLVLVGLKVPQFPGQETHYSLSFHEVSLGLGIIALVLLLYSILTDILPMEAREVRAIENPEK